MSKNPSQIPSVSERRKQEELRQKKARQRNMIIVGVLLALLAIAAVAFFLTRDDGGDNTAGTELTGDRPLAAIEPELRVGYYDEPPAMTIDTANEYQAVITLEDGGEMRFNLFDDEAPLTVNNFVFLATQGFYDGTTFHRVLADFMAQGGDPTGTGGGGPGYAFEDETDNGLTFDRRGLLAMANSGPDTNGSQFFVTFAPATHLDGAHTIFGELVEGDEVLSGISLRDPDTAIEPGDRIAEITIIEQ
jgi:cyclophilin family peptidyl-prolyl cis-trans isomerase